MSDTSRVRLSSQAYSDLNHLSSIFHLTHHRNHNQHRRSLWYRHFSVLRRQLGRLLEDYTELARIPDTHLGKHRKKQQDQHTLDAIQQRLNFWQDVLVPKAHHAFSQLAADGRFAVLGVVLLAALAQICSILGLTSSYEEMGQAEVEQVLNQFAQEQWPRKAPLDDKRSQMSEGEDFGFAIPRTDHTPRSDDTFLPGAMSDKPQAQPVESADLEQPPLEQAPPSEMKTSSKREPKMKKRKKNAIDDLFSGW